MSSDSPKHKDASIILFDMDGTLVNSRETMRAAFQEVYQQAGQEGSAPFDELLRRQGLPLPIILKELELPSIMNSLFLETSKKHIGETILYDGIVELLKILKKHGKKLAIVTGKSNSRAKFVLNHFQLAEYFSVILGSDDVVCGKPEPDMLLRAIELLGATPNDAVMVGDADADILAAKNAGVTSILALWGFSENSNLTTQPTYVARSPLELLETLSSISKLAVPFKQASV